MTVEKLWLYFPMFDLFVFCFLYFCVSDVLRYVHSLYQTGAVDATD